MIYRKFITCSYFPHFLRLVLSKGQHWEPWGQMVQCPTHIPTCSLPLPTLSAPQYPDPRAKPDPGGSPPLPVCSTRSLQQSAVREAGLFLLHPPPVHTQTELAYLDISWILNNLTTCLPSSNPRPSTLPLYGARVRYQTHPKSFSGSQHL